MFVAGIGGGIVVAVIVAVTLQYYALNNLQVQFSPRSVGDFDAKTLTLGVGAFLQSCRRLC